MGMGEIIVVVIVLLLVFGAAKIPQLGDALGKGIRNFKKAQTADDAIDVTPPRQTLPQGGTGGGTAGSPSESKKA
jgi:sec-independent protein translocase protein TatA